MARQLISSLEADFEPEKFSDTYRLAVLEMIDRKVAGEEAIIAAPAEEEMGSVVDLMAALEASVAEAKKARTRHPTAKAESASKKKPAKKTTAKKKAAAKKPAKKAPAKKAAAKKTAAKKPVKKAS